MASGAIRDGAAATAIRAGVNGLRLVDGIPISEDLAASSQRSPRQPGMPTSCWPITTTTSSKRAADKPRNGSGCPRGSASSRRVALCRPGRARLHGIELYRGRPIFHGLGNLILQTPTEEGFYDDAVWQSVVTECRSVGGGFREMTLTPIH